MTETKANSIHASVRKSILFKHLDEAALKEVLAVSDIVHYKPEDRIISEGEVSSYLYTILHGAVSVRVSERVGKEVYLGVLGEGDVFGEAGIFMSVKRTAHIVSAENTTLLRITREGLLKLIHKYPSAGVKMLLIIIFGLLRKLRESNQELAFERKDVMGQDDVDDIVAQFMKE